MSLLAPICGLPILGTPPPSGQQPASSIVTQAVIQQAWQPADPQPRQRPLTVAPLTLTYGQQPPPGPTQQREDLAIVRRSWEPPDPQPVQKPLNVVPLTLTYGQQPPRYSVALPTEIRRSWEPPDPQPQRLDPKQIVSVDLGPPRPLLPPQIVAAWPPLWYPAQSAPLTPISAQGQQPPPYSIAVPTQIRRTWEPPDPQPFQLPPKQIVSVDQPVPHAPLPFQVAAPWQPVQTGLPIAPLTLVYGQAPPPYSIVARTEIRQTWEPPDPPPVQRPLTVAPLALTYGQAPPPYSVVAPTEIRRLWEPPDPAPVQLPPKVVVSVDPPPPYVQPLPPTPPPWWPAQAAPLTPIPAQGQPPPPYSIVASTEIRRLWEPPDPQPVQKLLTAAPLTLIYGQQPPPYSVALPSEIRRLWEPPDPQPFQLPPRQIVSVDNPPPHVPPPLIVAPTWWPAQSAPPVAPLALVYGQPPPSYSIVGMMEVRALWEPPPPQPQRLDPKQIVSVDQPPSYSIVAPTMIRKTWEPPDPAPQRLTPTQIVSVDNPQPYAPLPLQVEAPWWPAQSAPKTVLPGWSVDNPPAPRLNLPSSLWEPAVLPLQAAQGIAATLLVAQPSFAPLPGAIILAWQPLWFGPPPPVQIAPLTLAYGQQPPPYSVVTPMAVRWTWEPPWTSAQSAGPVAPLTLPYGQPPPIGGTQQGVNRTVAVGSWPAIWYPAQEAVIATTMTMPKAAPCPYRPGRPDEGQREHARPPAGCREA